MTQEERTLLIKDLCARLPYGVKCQYSYIQHICIESLIHITKNGICNLNGHIKDICDIKPYLFPLSSMTEEQHKEFLQISGSEDIGLPMLQNGNICFTTFATVDNLYNTIEWFLKNNIDYNGLIDKGLAIDATGLNIY